MKLFFREEGSGFPIVIIHGLYGSSDNWLTVAKKLAPHYHVYSVDQRNHGHSPNSDIHDFESMKNDLAEFFEDHKIEKAIVIGHSMGGKTAMWFAAEYPERIEKLIVADIAPKDYFQLNDESQYYLHNNILQAMLEIDLSKIETGQVQVSKTKFSINRLVHDIQREYSFRATEKGIELELDPLNPKEDIIVESDQNKLRQVLINFVGNALKFTEKGFIEMGIRDQGESVYVQVKDTGIGIPEQYHAKVFERFRQVESAESRKYGGNGLGLAISKSLIEILGGEIGLKSAHGNGSIFYFTIPKHA